MKIWAHTMVKNEDHYIWYSLNSIIRFVDKIIVWDTGSSDKTVDIIKETQKIYPDCILFNQDINSGKSEESLMFARQRMLDETDADWIITLDGDEVWWEEGIKTLVETIRSKGDSLDSIVVRYINLAGDIFHRQEERASKYNIAGRGGNISLRAFSTRIPGIRVGGVYSREGYFDGRGVPIQERDPKKIEFLDLSYLHFTHLPRSSDVSGEKNVLWRTFKTKYEIGERLPLDFYYPEVFFGSRPAIVTSVWRKLRDWKLFMARWQTPLRKIKRRLLI